MYDYESDELYCHLVELVINVEGGYVNDPNDTGGPTKYGIAWNKNVGILQSMGFRNPTDIRNLTQEQAKQIYYQKYWITSASNRIKDKHLAFLHFDTAVNCGIGAAAKCLFRLSKDPRYFEGDGKNLALWFQLSLEYVAHRLHYYTGCKTWAHHGRGWANRLGNVIQESVQLV
ncbi:MAG: hypothetical protein K2X93_06770 [Candidatus Obscuribacterales bacterium]|nr:hypothetical protein [Candidatus Obscuribacterales bacterium]